MNRSAGWTVHHRVAGTALANDRTVLAWSRRVVTPPLSRLRTSQVDHLAVPLCRAAQDLDRLSRRRTGRELGRQLSREVEQESFESAGMKAIHAAPERKWTVADLAMEAAVSRSLLDGRFRDVLGLSPIRYVNEWRMRVAQDLLATTEVPVGAIARRVGYDSEEAFSRAFKRAHGRSPSLWRAGRSAQLTGTSSDAAP